MTKPRVHPIIERFSPLWFIAALGFGGTSIAGFALLNYTFPRPTGLKGMVHQQSVHAVLADLPTWASAIATYLEGHIVAFGLLHVAATLFSFVAFSLWKKHHPERHRALLEDNARNAITVAPALALGMTFNVLLVGGFFFSSAVRSAMNELMPWALGAWSLLFVYNMFLVLRVQRAHLEKGFDVLNMHFGWLLIPFSLAMLAVSGSGIAAMAKSPEVARLSAFLSFVPFSAGTFLLSVKLMSVFRSQYRRGLPEQAQYLPSFLMVIPIITLLSISLFRYGHFFEQHFGHVPEAYFALVTGLGWAFELWYFALGMMLLASYLKQHLFSAARFHESQWGLVCPLVAMSVLGAFVYKTLLPHPAVQWVAMLFLLADVLLIAWMAARQFRSLAGEAEPIEPAAAPAH